MSAEYNDIIVTGSIIDDTIIGQYLPSSGYFNTLELNGTGVSVSGHIHSISDIYDLGSGVSGLSNLGDIPSGVLLYTTGLNLFTTGILTDFARSILDDSDVDSVRSTLGLSSITSVSGVLVLGSDVAQDIILSDIDGSGTIFNNQNKNIDFIVKGSEDGHVFFYDASMARLGINTQNPDALLHIVSNCALDGLKIESNTNCTTGVHIFMLHNPGAVPVDGSYNGTISLAGRDHNSNVINYARIRSLASSTDNNSSSGTFGELHAFIDKNSEDNMVLRLSRDSVSLGTENTVLSDSLFYDIVGSGNTTSGNYFVIIGSNNSGTLNHHGIMIGYDNDHYNIHNHSIGSNIVSYGSGNTVAGFDVINSGNLNYIYGSDVNQTGNYNVTLGNNVDSSGSVSILLAQNSYSYGNANILIGSGIKNNSTGSISVGHNLIYSGNSGVVIGINSATTGNNNVLIGNNIRVISTGLFICGQNINISNVTDSLVLEKDVSINNASGVVIVGRGNSVNSTNNIAGLYGYKNISSNAVNKTNVLGSENSISNISGSLVVGSENFASGNVINTVSIGRHNYSNNNTFNNLFIGNFNNQSGYLLLSNGTFSGASHNNNIPLVNIIAVGNQNVFPSTGNMAVSIGNKNKVSSNSVVVIGHLNSSSGNFNTLLGKSNYLVGYDNILGGNHNNLFGNSNVVFSPRNTSVYGEDNIVLGNNSFISNGIVVGYDNDLYGDNNSIFGKQNDVGNTRYPFTATINAGSIGSLIIDGETNLQGNDLVVVYLTNPVGLDNSEKYIYYRTISTNGVAYAIETNKTSIGFSNGAISLRNDNVGNPITFNDAFDYSSSSIATGYIIRINQGSSNYIYGDNNIIASGTGNLILGRNNNVSQGLNNVLIGNGLSLSTTSNNTMIIGQSAAKRIVMGDNLVFNSGLGYNNVHFVATDNVNYASFDNVNKRVGIGTSTPRSTIDISGTLTTQALRIGLSNTPNLELVTNSDGSISTSTRTMVSGEIDGFTCKISDNISSGIAGFKYDVENDTYTWYNIQPNSAPVNYVPGLTITPNVGAVFNASNSNYDEEFNLTIYGRGIPLDAPILFNTEYLNNRIVMHNTVIDTGVFKGDVRVTGNFVLPSLPNNGTVLRLDSNNNLQSNQLAPNTLPSITTDYKITGYKTTRWFDTEKLLCLSSAENHTTLSDTFVRQEYNTIISNNDQYETIFNLQGLGSNPGSGFVVLFDNGNINERGLRIDYSNKQVGINVTPDELEDNIFLNGDDRPTTLVVNGTAHFMESIRVGEATTSGNILVADANGYLSYKPINLGLAANTLRWPLAIVTDGDVDYLALSSNDENAVALDPRATSVDDIGRMLAWNGDSSNWCSTSHLRAYKGDNDGNRYRNILFGDHASNAYLSTRDMHIYSAGSFHSTAPTYRGSSQYVQYYLRGSGTDTQNVRLFTDWSIDNSNPTADRQNQIVVPEANASPELFCWHYEAIISAIGKNKNDNSLAAGSLRVEGMLQSLDGSSTLSFSNANVSKFFVGENNPLENIGAELVSDGGLVGAIYIRCTGVPDYNILWSSTVRINQISLPNF